MLFRTAARVQMARNIRPRRKKEMESRMMSLDATLSEIVSILLDIGVRRLAK